MRIVRLAESIIIIVMGSLLVSGACADHPLDERFDFEGDPVGSVPAGWLVPPALVQFGHSAEVVDVNPALGERCVQVTNAGGQGFGNVMRAIDATDWRGSLVRLRASVRTEPPARAHLWIRIDRPEGQRGFYDNMGDRPITGDEWATYEIIGPIAEDALAISIGLMALGQGHAWLDDVSLEVINEADIAAEPARPLTERGLANVIAFTRLLGYVRHFHPSDEAAETDWNMFAIRGVHVVEDAADDGDLAARLLALFAPIAPTVHVGTNRDVGEPRGDAPSDAGEYTYWNHLGFGQGAIERPGMQVAYRSWREKRRVGEEPATDVRVPRSGDVTVRNLGAGVWCAVPLTVHRDGDGTLPRVDADDPNAPAPFDWQPPGHFRPTGNDRATRLAAVILAWNVLQHFNPYFDVVETDWDAALTEALRGAAAAPDGVAFLDTLNRLIAHLHDGHGRAWGPDGAGRGAYRLPFDVVWVGDQLVVSYAWLVDGVGPTDGDVILSIDGKSSGEIWAELSPKISGATEGWKRWRAAQEIIFRADDEPFTAELRKPGGLVYSIRTSPIARNPILIPAEPEKICQISPGIWYVDIDRITGTDFNAAVDNLATAKGIVFDLRGYPGDLSTVVISHLIDEPVTCAQWHIPMVRFPDREHVTFQFSNWQVPPVAPRFTDNVAFIIDGRAISYAETYMGIIEHYGLAEIVGAPTAGTNGNANSIHLPGGYGVIFTGMKVLKHDGSQHHGIGIIPTVPVEPTIEGIAAGRDELLEKAIEVMKGEKSKSQNEESGTHRPSNRQRPASFADSYASASSSRVGRRLMPS